MLCKSDCHHFCLVSVHTHTHTHTGTCSSGECVLPIQCGNGVLQGDEECECASGTSCKFCSNCKLQEGKECTPDSAVPCCDSDGKFLTTASTCTKQPEGIDGYCNRGSCGTTSKCLIELTKLSAEGEVTGKLKLDKFCGASENPCKAKCGQSSDPSVCQDTSRFSNGWGGDKGVMG